MSLWKEDLPFKKGESLFTLSRKMNPNGGKGKLLIILS